MPAAVSTQGRKRFETDESFTTAQELGLDFNREHFGLEEFRLGMDMELVCGSHDLVTDVTHNDPILTAKLVLAHLRKRPDYYTRLAEARSGCPSWLQGVELGDWTFQVALEQEAERTVPLSKAEEDCRKQFEYTNREAEAAAKVLGIDFSLEEFEVEDLRMAMTIELEHGCCHPETNITNCDPILTAKLALAHLRERGDFYRHLVEVEGNLPR
jgi:hypothetical protein